LSRPRYFGLGFGNLATGNFRTRLDSRIARLSMAIDPLSILNTESN